MAQFMVDTDEEVTIARKQKYEYPPFIMVGNGNANRHGTSLSMFNVLCDFSKPEQFAFKLLIEKLDCVSDSRKGHNVCVVRLQDLSVPNRQKFKAGIAGLFKKEIVKRTKKEHYIVNPNLIISKEYSMDLARWNSTK